MYLTELRFAICYNNSKNSQKSGERAVFKLSQKK